MQCQGMFNRIPVLVYIIRLKWLLMTWEVSKFFRGAMCLKLHITKFWVRDFVWSVILILPIHCELVHGCKIVRYNPSDKYHLKSELVQITNRNYQNKHSNHNSSQQQQSMWKIQEKEIKKDLVKGWSRRE